MIRVILFGICLAAIVAFRLQGMAQSQDEIKRRQNELQKLREQIQDLEKKAKQQQASESQVIELLETYDEKSDLLRKLIRKLRGEEQHLQGRISNTETESERLARTLDVLKQNYATYVTAIYKAGRQYDLELLFTSNSLNQLVIRNEYLKRFSAQRKRDAETIQGKKKGLDELQARLAQQLNDGRRIIAVKGAEEDRLAALSADRRDALTRIRKDKTLVQQQLQRQMKAAREMEGLIGKLIETERIRKERAAVPGRLPTLPKTATVEGAFEKKKGKLRWPVDAGRVVARFGPQKHPTLKTITQNTGIDIAVRAGSTVNAVAGGEVATIQWLPWYGNIVILNHANGYRTVYTHLAEIDVSEGEQLAEGSPIGKGGESLDGPRLHFEVWKEQDKQNPEVWLIPQ